MVMGKKREIDGADNEKLIPARCQSFEFSRLSMALFSEIPVLIHFHVVQAYDSTCKKGLGRVMVWGRLTLRVRLKVEVRGWGRLRGRVRVMGYLGD